MRPLKVWPLSLLVVVLCGTAACGDRPAAAASAAEREFLRRHWQRPIPPQGPAPATFSPIERSLAPESCGTCHPVQFTDWKTSLHARTMGPGVAGQLVEMIRSDPVSALSCLSSHAPLSEQAPVIPGPSGIAHHPDFDETHEASRPHLGPIRSAICCSGSAQTSRR